MITSCNVCGKEFDNRGIKEEDMPTLCNECYEDWKARKNNKIDIDKKLFLEVDENG